MVGGGAVFEAVHPAGVCGDVAPDGAGQLTRGIRGVVEAVGFHRLGHLQVGDPWLRGHGAVFQVDVQDLVHARQAHDHAVLQGQGPARKAGARAPGHNGDADFTAEPQEGGNFPGGPGQDHGHGLLAIGRHSVALVHYQVLGMVDDLVLLEVVQETADQLLALLQALGSGLGQLHGQISSPSSSL